MLVNVYNEQKDLNICPLQVQLLASEVVKKEGYLYDEVNIYFVDTENICELHKEFFNDPSSTDCISFPIDQEKEEFIHFRLLGELFVCPATAISYANQYNKDPYEETTLYVVHGLLHLIGYRDKEEAEIVCMREAEERHMKNLQSLCLQLHSSI